MHGDKDVQDAKVGKKKTKRTPKRLLEMVRTTIRREAEKRRMCLDNWRFIFGEQWDEKDVAEMEDEGRAPITNGRPHAAVALLVGQHIANRVKPRYKPVGKSDTAIATAANELLDRICERNKYSWRRAMRFMKSLCYGFGILKIVRNPDPRKEPVLILEVDPRDWYADPDSREMDMSDAAFEFEQGWHLLSDVKKRYPQFEEELEMMVRYGRGNDPENDYDMGRVKPTHQRDKEGRDYGGHEYREDDPHNKDYVDVDRKEVRIVQLYEKKLEKATIVTLPDGSWFDLDVENEEQTQALLEAGEDAIIESTLIYKMYYHVFCGDILLYSGPSPYDDDLFPYVVSWCYRDHEYRPTSIIEAVKDQVRDVNMSTTAMIEQLSASGLIVTPRAGIKDLDEFAKRYRRPNSVVMVQSLEHIKERTPHKLVEMQLERIRLASELIMEITGVNRDALGLRSDAKSGIAIQERKEQAGIAVLSVFENDRQALHQEAELILSRMQQFYTVQREVRTTEKVNGEETFIRINEISKDANGNRVILNKIDQASFDISVDDVSGDASERRAQMEQMMKLSEMWANTEYGKQMFLAALDLSDIPQKEQIREIFAQIDRANAEAAKAQAMAEAGIAPPQPQAQPQPQEVAPPPPNALEAPPPDAAAGAPLGSLPGNPGNDPKIGILNQLAAIGAA